MGSWRVQVWSISHHDCHRRSSFSSSLSSLVRPILTFSLLLTSRSPPEVSVSFLLSSSASFFGLNSDSLNLDLDETFPTGLRSSSTPDRLPLPSRAWSDVFNTDLSRHRRMLLLWNQISLPKGLSNGSLVSFWIRRVPSSRPPLRDSLSFACAPSPSRGFVDVLLPAQDIEESTISGRLGSKSPWTETPVSSRALAGLVRPSTVVLAPLLHSTPKLFAAFPRSGQAQSPRGASEQETNRRSSREELRFWVGRSVFYSEVGLSSRFVFVRFCFLRSCLFSSEVMAFERVDVGLLFRFLSLYFSVRSFEEACRGVEETNRTILRTP